MEDRRLTRSNNPREAAKLYLASLAERNSFSALTLSDTKGAVVAHSCTHLNGDALATFASVAGPGIHSEDGLVKLVTQGLPIKVCDLDIEGAPYLLAVVGEQADMPADTEVALNRIFA